MERLWWETKWLKAVVFLPNTGFTKSDNLAGAKPEDIVVEYRRDYPLGSKFAHVGGYLGEVSETEVGKIDPRCPEKGPRQPGSLIGRAGLELQYDCQLLGIDGEELVEVDTSGK